MKTKTIITVVDASDNYKKILVHYEITTKEDAKFALQLNGLGDFAVVDYETIDFYEEIK